MWIILLLLVVIAMIFMYAHTYNHMVQRHKKMVEDMKTRHETERLAFQVAKQQALEELAKNKKEGSNE